MAALMLRIRNWDDVLTQLPREWLKSAQAVFYLAFPIYGVITLLYGSVRVTDYLLISLGAVGIFFPFVIRYLPLFFKFVYTLWFHLSVFLLLMGFALAEHHKGFADSFKAIGGIFLGLLAISPLLGCNILAQREAAANARAEPAVAFQAIRNDLPV